MKKFVVLFIGCIAVFLNSSFIDLKPEQITIKVTNGALFIQQHQIAQEWLSNSFSAILGEPDRIDDPILIYDYFGVNLFPTGYGSKQTVSEVQVHFGFSDTANIYPHKTFKGTLKFDNEMITRAETPASVRRKLEEWTNTECYLSHNVKMVKDNIYVFFEFNESETKLNKVSFGYENDDREINIEDDREPDDRRNTEKGG